MKTLKEIKANKEYFKLLDKNGNPSKKTYLKSHYNREDKTYTIYDAEDVNAYRFVKASQKITTDFIY